MKKMKKMVSIVLALSMLASIGTASSYAEATEERVIMRTVDLSEYYNRTQVYRGDLAKVKYNDDGSVAKDGSGNILQTGTTGASGSAGYAGAFYYDGFKENQETHTWNTEWTDDMTVNTLTTASGTEYELKVADSAVDSSVKTAWSNAPSLDKVTKTEQFTTFELEDGYYKELRFLANTNYSGKKSNMVVKVNYVGGETDYFISTVNYFHNTYEDTGIKSKKMRGLTKEEIAEGKTEITAEMLNGYGFIREHSFETDTDKQVDSFGILNANYYITTDTETGEFIVDETGEYVIAECEKDENGKYLLGDNSKPHSVLLYAVTTVATEELELKNLNAGINTKINNLSDDLKYEDIDVYREIEQEIENYVSLGGSTEDIESYPMFEEKYNAVKLMEIVSVPYDMTGMYNINLIYDSDTTYGRGNAGYSGTIYYDSFIGDKYVTWKTPWSELEDGAIDNTLISEGVEFDLRVVDSKKNTVKTNCVYWNDNSRVEGEFTTLDVAAGKYKTVEILANAEKSANSKKMAVKLNYGDEYEIVERTLSFMCNGINNQAIGGIVSPRCNANYTTREELEAWCESGAYNKSSISHYSIPVNSEKTLTSVEILNDHYEIVVNEDGSFAVNNTTDTNGNGTLERNSENPYAVAIYAVTLTTEKGEILAQKEDEINGMFNELPDFEDISEEHKEILDKIGDLIEEYNEMGGNAEDKEFYGTYLYAMEMLENTKTVEINMDLTPYFNMNAVYTTGYTGTPVSAAYPGAFDYNAFIGDDYITWVTPWTDGMKENKLISDGHTFKMRVVDYGNRDKDMSNVIFWNAATSGSASNGIGAVSGEWTNFDVLDGRYKSVEILANSNRSPENKNDYSEAEIGKTLILRLNYSDGSVILGKDREFELNYMMNSAQAPVIQSLRHNGSTAKGTIRHLSVPVSFGKTLESIDVLNSGYTIGENDTVIEDTVRIDKNGNPYKDKNGNVLTNGTNHNAVIYAMTLVGTKGSVSEINADYINGIEEKIGMLTNSSEDSELMAEIEEMLKIASDRGITQEEISNISLYNAEYPYFAKLQKVTVTNDSKNADVIITFDRALTDEMIKDATVTVAGIDKTAVKISDNAVKVSFEHGLDYSDRELSIEIGYSKAINQLVKLQEPAAIENVLFYQGESVIDNFYNTTNNTFTVKADVNAYEGEKVMLALYNGSTLNTLKTAEVSGDKLECEFSVSEEMDENWVLKAFVWDSVTGMVPQNKAKVLNKTYGYDNLTDLTKDLTVVYFGDSQTEGKMFSNPLTGALEAQREDEGATVTAINAGQGGTAINLGMYRLDSEVIAHNPDIVFVEFYPNDSNISSKGETTAEALAKDADLLAYHENVIKRLLALDHVPMIIYMNPMKEPTAAGVVSNYYSYNVIKPLLDYYGIPAMDFQKEAERLIATGDYTWDNFRKSTSDVHFTKEGGEICAAWMYGLMTDDETKDTYVKKATLGLPDYQAIQYEHPQMISSHYGIYDNKWEITSLATATEGYNVPVTGDAFPNEYMAATEVGAEMTFTFKGRSLYIYTLIGAYGGKAEYEIDGVYTGTIDTYSTNSKSMYKSAKLVKAGLEDAEHTVTIRVIEPNTAVKSEKAYFGIGKFMVEKN